MPGWALPAAMGMLSAKADSKSLRNTELKISYKVFHKSSSIGDDGKKDDTGNAYHQVCSLPSQKMSALFKAENCGFLKPRSKHGAISPVISRTKALHKTEQLPLRCDISSVSYLSASLAYTELRQTDAFSNLLSHTVHSSHKIQSYSYSLSKIFSFT